jgi:hypothetical protein
MNMLMSVHLDRKVSCQLLKPINLSLDLFFYLQNTELVAVYMNNIIYLNLINMKIIQLHIREYNSTIF